MCRFASLNMVRESLRAWGLHMVPVRHITEYGGSEVDMRTEGRGETLVALLFEGRNRILLKPESEESNRGWPIAGRRRESWVGEKMLARA